MSKKIAQLTKVIYHLNTKNEDHALELESLNAQHESEIDQILRDAADKINRFKEQISQRKAQAEATAMLDRMTTQYEAEKKEAREEMRTFKLKARDVEEDLHRTYETKVCGSTCFFLLFLYVGLCLHLVKLALFSRLFLKKLYGS